MSQKYFQFSPQYGFVRGRQLEGTFSQGPEVGVWIVTANRVAKGWGLLQESDWPYSTTDWPPKEPPAVDSLAKKIRVGAYQRIRDFGECKRVLAGGMSLVSAAFQITDQWFSALDGIIEEPSVKTPITKKSHAVCLMDYDDNKHTFKFPNSWGNRWGDHGYGYLPYEYFDKYILESWTMNNLKEGRPKPFKGSEPGLWVLDWSISDVFGGVLYGIELYQSKEDEFIGWTFAVRRWGATFLDVEELFVRPAFRGLGEGKFFAQELRKLAEREGLPLRLWIPHADANPANLMRVEKIVKRLALRIEPGGVRWASLKAVP
jgi:GNAT superfamily N-acetyltransferase